MAGSRKPVMAVGIGFSAPRRLKRVPDAAGLPDPLVETCFYRDERMAVPDRGPRWTACLLQRPESALARVVAMA